MRGDMFEVIVERPRGGGRRSVKGRSKERGERARERAPKQLGMGRMGQTKFLSENLAPLIRFLSRRIGLQWNAVRSEMSDVLSVRSAVQKHVLDHVKQLVELHPRMIGGVPHEPRASAGVHRPLSQLWCVRFYVCPERGRLCAVARS